MITFDKYGQHQPLNRQAERIVREGIDLSLSTLADLIGHACVALAPIHALIERHVLDAGRLHGPSRQHAAHAPPGQRTIPRCRFWRTGAHKPRGSGPMCAMIVPGMGVRHLPRSFTSQQIVGKNTRHGTWPGGMVCCSQTSMAVTMICIWQIAARGPVRSALCWSHARRKFFELADIKNIARKGKKVAEEISPIALDAVTRIDAIFAVEREITGLSAAARHEVRQQRVAPLVNDLHDWMRAERARMSKHNPVAKAINYMLDEEGRWEAFTAFLDDGRLCLTNNTAERALRGISLGIKSWLFAGSERGGDRAAFMYTLIVTAKTNDIDPQAWMADVLARLPDMPISRVHELLPWNWKTATELKRITA